jgi:YHS domain-containing protein
MAKCPVCKGDVNEDAAKAQTGMTSGGAKEVDPTMGTRQFHDGTWYYFDTLECRNKFTRNPDGYLQGSA